MLTEKRFDTGEVTLNYAEGPKSGPPLLLLHGQSQRWQEFLPMIPFLSTKWHVYALDFRGHGKSGHVKGPYRLEDYMKDTIAFLKQKTDEPVVLIGHSLGGMVGIMVAAQLQQGVKGLVIGDSPLYNWTEKSKTVSKKGVEESIKHLEDLIRANPSIKKLATALEKEFPKEHPVSKFPYFHYWAKSWNQLDPQIWTLGLEETIAGYDCAKLFPQISCPVLILQTTMITDEDAKKASSQIADVTILKFENLGHLLFLEPEGYPVILAVTLFLESL